MATKQFSQWWSAGRTGRLLAPALVGAFFVGVPEAHAGRVDTAHRLLADEKDDLARNKCQRWDAANPTTELPLREVCAEAFWPLASEQDDEAGWVSYRSTWAGTRMAERALQQEARVVLRDSDPMESESWFLAAARKYGDTPVGSEFERMASNAAVRDASSGDDAAEVARRYPRHPGLVGLVERFPEGFLKVELRGTEVKVQVDPPVKIPEDLGPWARWVMWDIQGKSARAWDQVALEQLQAWGISLGSTSLKGAAQAGSPRIPVCYLPDFPAGETPAIEISLGTGRMYRPIGWADGCGPDGWPVFLVYMGEHLRAVSLRPGHLVSLEARPSADHEDVQRWFPSPSEGALFLDDGAFHRQLGDAWLVTPVSGGASWLTGKGPSPGAVSLSEGIRASGMPAGWRLSRSGNGLRVDSQALSKMPPALRNWTLPSGEVRTIPPLVQQVLGLSSSGARSTRPASPQMGPNAGWQRLPSGGIDRVPPTNATIAGIYGMEVGEVVASLTVSSALGLGPERVEAFDGWRADLDGDRVMEIVIRGLIDDEGVVMVLDPVGEPNPTSARSARLFISSVAQVRSNHQVADTPFTYRKGDYLYLAWGSQTHLSATRFESAVGVVRSDGTGFVSEGIVLP